MPTGDYDRLFSATSRDGAYWGGWRRALSALTHWFAAPPQRKGCLISISLSYGFVQSLETSSLASNQEAKSLFGSYGVDLLTANHRTVFLSVVAERVRSPVAVQMCPARRYKRKADTIAVDRGVDSLVISRGAVHSIVAVEQDHSSGNIELARSSEIMECVRSLIAVE
ncbi:hypothetical protein EVAR_20746_1 [Eumeta japonica]|uniref:Uncharacterized protein n=1 Tax=Eumeta variegata TaxID=151549 RepID=A0A4C1V9G3_EUMVA|nr:hypothetical protein EVAR_20746_1 [Eumeta japonica]